MMKLVLRLILLMSVFVFVGCSSTDTSEEETVLGSDSAADVGELEDELGDSEGGDDFSDDEPEDSEDLFAEDSGGDDFGDEGEDDFGEDDFGDDEFAEGGDDFGEDDFGDEAGDDFGGDEFAQDEGGGDDLEPLADEPMEDQAMQEDPAADQSFEEPITPAPVGDDTSFGPSVKIQNIKFLANQSGGTIAIDASGPLTYQPRVNSETNQFVIDLENVELPDNLKRPYILKEFPQAMFGAINAYQDPGSSTARVVVQMKSAGFAEPVLQAEGNTLYVIPSTEPMSVAESEVNPGLEPPTEEVVEDVVEDDAMGAVAGQEEVVAEEQSIDIAAAASDEAALGSKSLDEFLTGNSKFYGRPISIQVKDADIRDILGFIANESGTNMIIAQDVSGTISLKLREIPWDQALVTVMKAKGLGYVREGSVIRIATLQRLQQEASEAQRIIEAQQRLTPLRVRVIPVSYAKVSEISNQVTPFLTQGRGNVVFDDRTNSLIVTDTDEKLDKIQRLVAELDVAPAQVLIEGKVVEAVETFRKVMGINWSSSGANVEISGNGGVGGNPVNLNTNLAVTSLTTTAGNPFNAGIEVGTLEVLGDLSARLSLAESDQLVNIISSPRVVTMNKTPATITQNSEVVSISTVVNNGVSTRQVVRDPVVVNLQVNPQITADGSVIMDIRVDREFAGVVVDTETQARPINRRQAQTTILVKNGATAVIGGMYNSTDLNNETGAPGLMKIPVLGWLFKSTQIDREKNELIFFLTPRILNLQEQSPSQKMMSKNG